MFRIRNLNRISTYGLDLLPRDNYEVASDIPNADAILVRSYSMLDMQLPLSLKAIARAGIGVSNVPVDVCTERGIVVFNTPGANANSVKELVLAALLISSRDILAGAKWAKSLSGKGDEIPSIVEKNKARYAGPELRGKKLGVIGLGAIGVMVANDALSLGMDVTGFDPFISVESAWGLSRNVSRAMGIEAILTESDYITIHVPLTEKTRGMINKDRFSVMKRGMRLLNFARGGLIKNDDLIEAIKAGVVKCYVSDFPEEELLRVDQVIAIPHLGASTPEAEDNCAIMAVKQIRDFLEYGNIKNSVNFPECDMSKNTNQRIIIANRNIPNMVGQITTLLAEQMINISDLLNKHKDGLAYNIIDVDQEITSETILKIKEIEGVVMVRVI
jgi:D-3-phosphoglycerate dehydrogenase